MNNKTTQQNIDFNNEMGPTYACENCGNKFKSKFQDYILCMNCRNNIHKNIDLSKSKAQYQKEIKKFINNYKPKKKR